MKSKLIQKAKIPFNLWMKVYNQITGFFGLRRNQSFNTPAETADVIRYFIQGKVVCDIGCDSGHFMQDMQKYAKEVVGTEIDEAVYKRCLAKGLKVFHADALTDDMPNADVYFTCIDKFKKPLILENLRKYGKKGLFIVRVSEDEGEWDMHFKVRGVDNYLKIITL